MQSSLSCCQGRRVNAPVSSTWQPKTNSSSSYPLATTPQNVNLTLPSRSYSLNFQLQPNKQNPRRKPFWPLSNALYLEPKWSRKPKTQLHCGISSNDLSAGSEGRGFRGWIELAGEVVSTAFPIWVSLGCLLGLFKPSYFNWVTPQFTMLGLTVTMLGMGMSLTLDELSSAFAMPKQLLAGFALQYSVMPISGFLVSKLLNLPSYYAAGLILLSCCPGGTASNIVTYIARGNVALSVVMTAVSTFAAVVMTPFLTAKLAGQYVAVDAVGLLTSTMQVVLLPVLAGAFLNQYFQGLVKFVSPLMPPTAVVAVAILCGNAIAQSAAEILDSGRQVVLAVLLLHASGFFFGYVLSRMLRLDEASSRTISIEVGMQNSALGIVLATQHLGNPLTAVPCAVASVCQSILGSALAGVWRSQPTEKQD